MNLRRTPAVVAAATLAALTLIGTASLAHAAAPSNTEQVVVRFDDLNLATPAGLQALYLRIQNAARSVCGSAELPGSRVASEAWTDCVTASIRGAISEVNQPALTAYYATQLRPGVARTSG